MTTAVERMRAISWGFDLLSSTEADERLSMEIREQARAVRSRYPFETLMAALREPGVKAQPADLEERLNSAWEFFRRLQREATLPSDVRKRAMYTLRHFPLPGSAYWASLPEAAQSLAGWLKIPSD